MTEVGAAQIGLVAAEPGFFVLTALFGETPDEPPEITREPVVAWWVYLNDRKLVPLCVDELVDGSNEPEEAWAILYPNGKVLDRDQEASFLTVDAWVRYHRNRYEVEFSRAALDAKP